VSNNFNEMFNGPTLQPSRGRSVMLNFRIVMKMVMILMALAILQLFSTLLIDD